MPNFIAEWSGIFIAVAIVDRLIERERYLREVVPLRQAAAVALSSALRPVIDVAFQDAGVIVGGRGLEHWLENLDPYVIVRDTWLRRWQAALRELAQRLQNARSSYWTVFESAEIDAIDDLLAKADEEVGAIDFDLTWMVRDGTLMAGRFADHSRARIKSSGRDIALRVKDLTEAYISMSGDDPNYGRPLPKPKRRFDGLLARLELVFRRSGRKGV